MAACPGCGADRSSRPALPCLTCGRIEIEIGDTPAPRARSVESPRPQRSRAAALGAVAALVIGGLTWSTLSRGDGGPAAPATSATAPSVASTAPATPQPSFVTVPPTVSPLSTVVRRINNATEDYFIFGDEVAYRLYLIDATSRIAGYVDPNTGRYVASDLRLSYASLHPADDGRLFVNSNGASIVDRGLVTQQNIVSLVGDQGYEPGSPGRIWSRRATEEGAFELVEFDAAGNVFARAQAPGVLGHFRWLAGTEFVVAGGGRIFVFDAKTRQSRTYAIGEVSTVQSERIVWRGCDSSLRCTLYLGTSSNPTWRNLGDLPSINEDALSPDANWVVVFDQGSVVVRDLRTNRDRPIPRGGSPRGWTPDSRFLFFRSALGFAALDLETDRVIDLNPPIDIVSFVAI